MNWWPIAKNLRDFLQVQPALAEVDVHAGAASPIERYPCIEVLWDDEGGIDPHKNNKGNVTLWIDCWVENHDPDPAVVYGLLHSLQIGFFNALDKWPKVLSDELDLAIKITVGKTVSDGDTNRPSAGSRTILEIEWRGGKNNEYSKS